ncbi:MULTISPECIES: TetR/AcrR family transcriptional regulator [Streptomyces]|uniref:TetR/AcrR family transcriptional regulator n=1 Tax=Streptomyces chengmaiensis TaxID=3040919 RepID=A0ABT6HH28_9ACTN|nr:MULTISPECIES: TetR/AcrR family transcriptional regulator [Streptomyces]MDH2388061.1 TetR/AcrR family transcriptional regulator [Streptomyces chengmaiensis]WRQ79987.1 TetR/AcrR family transcriptional regulator [Streptomyces sp. MUM 178J]
MPPHVHRAAAPGHPSRGGRRRDPAADRAILEAALALLGEGCSFADLSMDLVAQRAGVARATVYRRWRNKEELVLAALGSLDLPVPHLEGLPLRDKLVALVDQIRHRGQDTLLHRLLAGLVGEAARRPHLVERFEETVVAQRRRAFEQALSEGVESGELRADLDVDQAIEMLTGPMLSRLILRQRPVDSAAFAESVVDMFLNGTRSRPGR